MNSQSGKKFIKNFPEANNSKGFYKTMRNFGN